MKYFVSLLLVFSATSLFAQEEPNPPEIWDVLSITLIWSYITEDTNWYRIDTVNNLHFDQFSSR